MSNDQNFDDIKVKPTALDIGIETLTILVCAATWGFLIFRHVCPESFSDVFRSPRINDFFLYAISTFVCFFIFTKNKPLSKSIKITKENAERQYRLTARHNHWARFILMILFSWQMFNMNLIQTDATEAWFGTAILGTISILLATTLYYYIRARMLR